ncbi:MAG: recombinase family protein [Planctomycetota bacterium]
MIQTKFDPTKPIRYVMYGRMSSDQQNPRSPDQQYDEIERTLKRNGYSWVPCGKFRDDGLSGRKMSNRPSFMQMMDDIKSGRLSADAILVDSFERFGRMRDVDNVRQNLLTKFGVMVLTADSNFTDPTSVPGKALGFVESFRATQDAHVKAHNVLRGKRDIVSQKYWPGGPKPMGYKLESVTRECDGRTEIIGSRLVSDPQWAPVVREVFDMADTLGLGSNRIAQTLNKRSDLVQQARARRFHSDTIGRILSNPIYKGVMVFGRVATDIVDDRKVTVRNAAEEHFIVKDFCEPLITLEQWDRVNAVRSERGASIKRLRGRNKSNKQFQALAPGMILKFPLSGLVRCGVCGASMRPNQGGGTSKRGRRFVYYMCPSHHHGSCTNPLYCPEDWLRESVLSALRNRLFLAPGTPGEIPAWFPELVAEVDNCLEELAQSKQSNARPALEQELKDIESKIKGWTLSFGDPNLPTAMRGVLMEQSKSAFERRELIARELAQIDNLKEIVKRELNPKRVLDCLQQLATVMAGSNPTQLNHELSRHIDRIEVFPDRRVVMRTCRLGVFEGLDFVLSNVTGSAVRAAASEETQDSGVQRIKPRLRVKLNVDTGGHFGTASSTGSRRIEDPEQFADFDEQWFWVDHFQMPDNRCWSEENADQVARVRAEEGQSLAKLAKRFGVSIPTIRRALRIAGARLTMAALN